MKIVLIVLIFGLLLNLTSAFFWFNARPTEQPKQIITSLSTHRLTSRIQSAGTQQRNQLRNGPNSFRQIPIVSNGTNLHQSSLKRTGNRLQSQVRNTTVALRRPDSINRKSNRVVVKNRFRAIEYHQQQQDRVLNNPSAFRQTNGSINKTKEKMVNSRFHPTTSIGKAKGKVINANNRRFFLTTPVPRVMVADSKLKPSRVLKNKMPQRFSNRSVAVTGTKTSLLRALTTKTVNNNVIQDQQRFLADYYYAEQIKALNQRLNEQNALDNRSNGHFTY